MTGRITLEGDQGPVHLTALQKLHFGEAVLEFFHVSLLFSLFKNSLSSLHCGNDEEIASVLLCKTLFVNLLKNQEIFEKAGEEVHTSFS